ncbi:helix-turn-helix domain-containing protein [Alicyclobacillus shizuokensis]|uniref:helix-turn-helix domain-containing protein n=1 Tax=Alicyclobacillus shizuokensis TaxID=392014 RepID=UPI00082A14C3|nr:helix-turn-helix transcriptional regulator [Alicyclobacillus shizuokensis]
MNDDFMDDLDLGPEDVSASARPFVDSGPLDVKEFGKWLKALREEQGLTLTQLADKVGYSNPYLSQIETGKKKNPPSPELLAKLAEHLGVRYSDMLRMAGYTDLAKGIALKEAQSDFSDTADEYRLLELKQQARLIQEIADLKTFLNRKVSPFPKYNGHVLTEQDKKRILDMLALLFPQYQEPPSERK